MKASHWENSDRPSIGSEWRLEEREAGIFLARSESGLRFVQGTLLGTMVQLMDGQRPVSELVKCLNSVEPEQVLVALALLEKQGLIARNEQVGMPVAESAYWRLMGAEERRTVELSSRIVVVDDAVNEEQRAALERVFSDLCVTVSAHAAFRLVVARDYLSHGLVTTYEECRREGSPWMLVRPYGRRHWIGPLFEPEGSGCWYCLAWWLTINGWSASSVRAELPVLTRTTLELAAIEAAKWLRIGQCTTVAGRIREFDTASLLFTEHRILPAPDCPDCRSASKPGVELHATLSPLTGVSARLELLQEWPGVAVFAGECSQKVAKLGSGGAYYFQAPPSFGVAETTGMAAAVCLTEAVERYSARYQGNESVTMAGLNDLGSAAIDPAALLMNWPIGNETLGWVEARSLISGERRYIPAGYVYLGYDPNRFHADTAGCAASATLESAMVGGLLELIERDGVSLWWYNRARRPEIDVDSIHSAPIEAGRKAVLRAGKRVHILDLTSDFGIPICVAIATGPEPGIAIGCAAHPNPERCLWKALTEVIAMIAWLEAPKRDQPHCLDNARIEEYPYLIPAGTPVRWEASAEDPCLSDLLKCSQELNLDVLAVNLTRAELGIPVVRMIVPGLRSFVRNLAPGRLYEVPLKMGWIRQVLNPDEMNTLAFPD